MQNAAVPAEDAALSYPSPLKEFWQGFSYNKGAVAGLIFMSIVVLCAVLAPLVAPYSPIEQYRDHLLTPPAWLVVPAPSCWVRMNWAATSCRV
jgi:dipeptide transport system permease protein